MENDDLNDIPPQVNLINDKRFNYCINEQTYQVINEKKNLLQALKRQRDDLMIGFEARNRFIYVKNELVNNMMLKRLNITQLKDELVRFESTLKTNKEELSQIKKRIVKKRQSLSTYVQKIEKCKDMLERSKHAAFNKTNNEKDGFNILKLRLIEYEKQRIDELNRFIFDLVEFKPKDDELLHKSTQTALKDARQTVYVNGRWILANDHVVYKIVRSTLPTDGDYMPYFKEFQSAGGPKSESGVGGADDEKLMPNDDHLHFMSSGSGGHHSSSSLSRAHQSSPLTIPSSPTSASAAAAAMLSTSTFGGGASGAGPNSPRSIDRRSTLSGLTFTVQFVNLIAFYLNIVLPYNIPHNKFCTQPLTDDQFQNAVAKLNTNIVYLSINQHIPVTNLLPKHTLENLHHFLTYFREMRIKLREKHSISFPNHIIPLLEEMFTDSDEDNQLIQDSMPNLIFTDNEDWETVPNSNEIPSDDTYTQTQSRQTRAVSTSLISSVLSQFWFKKQQPE